MAQLSVWLNMISFATMAGAVGLLYLANTRTPRSWLVHLIAYTALYGLWVLISSYTTFQVLFLPDAPPVIGVIFVWVRLGMSFLILVAGSVFYLRFSFHPLHPGLLGIPAVAVLLMGTAALVSILGGAPAAGIAASVVFNGTLGTLSVVAARQAHRSSDSRSRFTGFLWFTAAVYFIVLLANIVVPVFPIPSIVSVILVVLSTGAFTLIWGVYLAVLGMKWLSASVQGTHPEESLSSLVKDFGISPRESDVLWETVSGKSSKEIAATLFISARTVETHLQNIYHKCGVTSRVGLVNLCARYTSQAT